MLKLVKHTAFRVWATVFFGGFACLWLVPFSPWGAGRVSVLLSVGSICLISFLAVGFFMNRLGMFLVNRLITEAAAWEIAGGIKAARETYEKAVAVVDSFLMSPMGGRKSVSLPSDSGITCSTILKFPSVALQKMQ